MASTETAQAASLNVGDAIVLLGGSDTIVSLRPYTGPLVDLAGARIAKLARGREITLEPTATFERLFSAVSQ